jgi:hypothetical protein
MATGEMLTSALEHGELIRHRAADVLMPDAPRVGGITPFLKIAGQAEQAGLMLAPHFAMELHVHLAAAYPTEPWVEHFDWLEPLFNERLEIQAGRMQVPRPGREPERTGPCLDARGGRVPPAGLSRSEPRCHCIRAIPVAVPITRPLPQTGPPGPFQETNP